jgi:hypothetical protein
MLVPHGSNIHKICLFRNIIEYSKCADPKLPNRQFVFKARCSAAHDGARSETQTIVGLWRHEGESYRDDLIRVFVDAKDEAKLRRFLLGFKDQLKARFQQIDVWPATDPIDVL